ncbi:hypothetical protein [Spirillospora sp. CA-294931]|uniref:hypothetical protein n=1 Tax=Spirillospora sp. CA-294931 TaxID=3240042 RepID=UPI003D8A6352
MADSPSHPDAPRAAPDDELDPPRTEGIPWWAADLEGEPDAAPARSNIAAALADDADIKVAPAEDIKVAPAPEAEPPTTTHDFMPHDTTPGGGTVLPPPPTVVDQVISTGPLPAVPAAPPSGGWQPAVRPPSAVVRPTTPKLRRPVAGLVAGLSVGMVLLLALVLAVVLGKPDGRAEEGGKATRRVVAAPVAAGLSRDPAAAPAASAAYPFIASAVRTGGVEKSVTAIALYTDGPAQTQNFLFMGGSGKLGDPADLLQRTRPNTLLTAAKANPGPGGGQAVCGTFAVLADIHQYCAWATRSSFGLIASNTPALTSDTGVLAALLPRMRTDLEKKT